MTDAFEVAGEFAPAETMTHSPETTVAVAANEVDVAAADAPEVPEVPNGFVELGLARELVAAVKDLGYTQPTIVQQKTIPLALPTSSSASKEGYIDLMVSSQTGSGDRRAHV